MKPWAWMLIIGLLVLHQDYWQWERDDIVWGFVPYPMAYNIAISLATAGVWIIVTRWSWPSLLPADEDDPS